MMADHLTTGELRARLAHVYWIGGSPCSGKSRIDENAASIQMHLQLDTKENRS